MGKVITPLKNRVILESLPDSLRGARLELQPKIIVPGLYAETNRLARVVAVNKHSSELEVGELVLCNRYPVSAHSFPYEGRELVSVEFEEILARVQLNG